MTRIAGGGRGDMTRLLAACVGAVVAGGASAGSDAAVAYGRRGPGGGAVTGVAGSRGGNVPGRLALGSRIIVAGLAAARRNSAVGKTCRGPARRAMAGIARYCCGDMRGWFAFRHRTVVTGYATAGCNAVVREHRRGPAIGTMAGIAGFSGRDMADRLRAGAGAAPGDMAGRAVARGPLEHAACMTGFAAHLGVLAGQRKTGLDVIEAQGETGIPRAGGPGLCLRTP